MKMHCSWTETLYFLIKRGVLILSVNGGGGIVVKYTLQVYQSTVILYTCLKFFLLYFKKCYEFDILIYNI